MTNNDLIPRLLPTLARSLDVGFNVFDVMHHGTHEKQLSNVFRWLLDVGGTHDFGALGQQLFMELVNSDRANWPTLPPGPYAVRQEVNTAAARTGGDIADIVLENDSAAVVIENFDVSDGHGHGYDRYLEFTRRQGRIGAVVLLCATEDRTLQTQGWENASVVTYDRFLDRLVVELERDGTYAKDHADQYAFIRQLHQKYSRGEGRMSDNDVLDFVTAMCATGEARRYQAQKQDLAAEQFANEVAQQAREAFREGREVLQRVKAHLRAYASTVVSRQLNASLGEGFVQKVTAAYSGIYQWTINFETAEAPAAWEEARLQIKFGPSAWFANERDEHWNRTVPAGVADYSRLFLTRVSDHAIRQSSVSLHEALAGLSHSDTRLHDELLALIHAS